MKNPAEISGVFPCAGVPPGAISHGNLLRIVTAPPVPGIGGQCPLTISHGGFLRFVTSLTRPVSAACPPNFFTIHSSLFPKKAWSCYCGGNRSANQSPPCQRGVVWRSQTGGIPQAGRFPHRFVLSRSTSCESLSHGYAVPAPFGKGALRAVPADNFAR